MDSYKIFTVEAPAVKYGVEVDLFKLNGVDIKIPAVTFGERGNGAHLGVIPVRLRFLRGKYPIKIKYAAEGQTKKGNFKLMEFPDSNSNEFCFALLKPEKSFKGKVTYHGDLLGFTFRKANGEYFKTYEEAYLAYSKIYGKVYNPPIWMDFEEFPGEIISRGTINAGYKGYKGVKVFQVFVKIPRDKIFTMKLDYGGHYEIFFGSFDGTQITMLGLDEKKALGAFNETKK